MEFHPQNEGFEFDFRTSKRKQKNAPKISKTVREKTMERSLLLFRESVKSKQSFETYLVRLKMFMKYHGFVSYDEITRKTNLQELFEDWIIAQKQRVNPNGLATYYYGVKGFLDANEIELNYKKIKKFFPQKIKKSGRKPYTTQQIKQLIDSQTSIRNKAIIHFVASSGIRIGVLVDLKVRNLLDMPLGCKAVCVYEGSLEEHWTFLTPEASKFLEQYFETRKNDGEMITPNSPVFRDVFRKQTAQRLAMPLKRKSFGNIISKAQRRSGVNLSKENGRHETMSWHGMRKRFVTILKNEVGIQNAIVERLVGHKIYSEDGMRIELDDSYFRPTLDELFDKYKLAIPALTVDDLTRVQIKEFQIQKQYSAFEEEKQKHFEEKKRWYKTILNRARTEGEIPDWLRPVMDEMIQDFES